MSLFYRYSAACSLFVKLACVRLPIPRFNDDTRISLIVGVIFLALVVISYYVFGIGKRTQANLTKSEQAAE